MAKPRWTPKRWADMTRAEKLAAWDRIEADAVDAVDKMAADLNAFLVASGCPIRIDIQVSLGVSDNREDPRLS
jgi:hypothetical protein